MEKVIVPLYDVMKAYQNALLSGVDLSHLWYKVHTTESFELDEARLIYRWSN